MMCALVGRFFVFFETRRCLFLDMCSIIFKKTWVVCTRSFRQGCINYHLPATARVRAEGFKLGQGFIIIH